MLPLLLFVLGLIVGSFLNVVILRLHTGRSFVTGRSQCATCAKSLPWYELLPVVSFFVLKGRCSGCKSKISFQYALVELTTAFLFLLFGFFDTASFTILSVASLGTLFFHLGIVSVLVVVFVYDLRHMIIPDSLSIGLIVLGLSLLAFEITISGKGMLYAYSHLLSAIFVAGFLWFLWKVSEGRWMGLGDSKFMAGLALLTGLPQGLSGLAFAFWIGAIVSLLTLLAGRLRGGSKKITMKSEIPFAPFLIIGMLIAVFFQSNIFSLAILSL